MLTIKKTPEQIRKTKKKYENEMAFEDKKWLARGFIDSFNRWRSYFCDRDNLWKPKSIGQLKMIDSINEMLKENNYDKDVFLVCCFLYCQKWTFNVPNLSLLVSRGQEIYEERFEDANAELDKIEYLN